MSLRFEHPEYLLLALAAIPLLLLGWRAMANTDRLRRITALALRALLFSALAIMLAGPHMLRVHDHLTVIGLLDISGSVRRFADLPPISGSGTESERRSNIEFLRQWFRTATKTKAPDDRFGLVVFDGTAIAVCAPTRADYVDDNLDISISQGTNIADAVRLGLAMFPSDTAKRLVLVTDGNETAGSVMEAVKSAGDLAILRSGDLAIESNRSARNQSPDRQIARSPDVSIPIDILPIAYNVTGDVQVVRVEAPPNAMPGQAVTVRIILEATAPTFGALTLRREGDPVDLNGSQPGTSRHLNLPAGQSVQLAQVELGQTPINRFEAIFEADNPGDDVLPDNDRAEAFTATPSKGSVLVLNTRAGDRSNALVQMLNSADLPAKALQPSQLPDDLLALQNYDLIVLDNVSAAELSAKQQQMLTKYVNDLGGGLIMVGGENSFGAGGWNGSIVESVLPVELDPSKELRLPTAALVLVLDKSGSMNQPVAGARKSQQQVANEGAALAIESLRSDSMVGVITFDLFAHVVVPLQTNEDPKKLSERVRSITADGGTNLEPGLQKAFDMLKDAKVAKKRVVCMSDGRSASREGLADLAKEMNDAGIQVSAIAVGDDADEEMLRNVAQAGGGIFYSVRDPRRLPQVLIESVQVINNPLLKEGPFAPRVLPTGSTLTAGMEAAPPLGGLVITSAKPDPTIAMEMLHPDGEPLLAHWQAGLGRVAAFTSELPQAGGGAASGGAWAAKWSDWPTAGTFWVQLARMIARPPMNQDAELNVTVQDDRVNISLDYQLSAISGQPEVQNSSGSTQNSTLDYLQVEGTVYKPDGTSTPVRLRQVAPGRFETSVDAALAGNYIVALNPRQGSKQLPPAIGGTNRATSPEFRRYKSNIGLLDEIAEETGGRRLSVTEPTAANLFDRTGMPPSISSLPIWRSLLALALGLMLLDVACRRLAWDYGLLRGWAAKAIARVTPSHVRGREVAATLATLRRVSDDVESRQAAASVSFSQSPNRHGGIPRSPEERSQSPDRQIARSPNVDDSARITAALDALMGRSAPKSPAASQPPDDQPQKDAGEAAAETTGSLLAAKRRARKRFED